MILARLLFFIVMDLNKISSAILNDLWGGNLIPLSNRSLISQEQIEDEIIEERNSIIKEWYLRNTLDLKSLASSINCIEVDCKDQNKCSCKEISCSKVNKHFEIPMLVSGLGKEAIQYIGSTDKTNSFKLYFSPEAIKYQKYRRRTDRPYVYLDTTPNEHNMCDGWIFNAPLVKYITVIGVFKDPRQLKTYNCCESIEYLELGTISGEIKRRILAKKVQLYRAPVPAPSQTTA